MAGKYSTIDINVPAVAAHAPVEHLAAPPTFHKPKRIHSRRVLPKVSTGRHREIQSTAADVARIRSAPAPAGTEVALDTVTPLTGPATQNTASNVGDASLAMNGDIVICTGNWYAGVSTDAGKTFSFIDPASAFKQFDPPGKSFCCDQVVQYIPSLDTFVWLLQYGPDTGDNIQRLAFAKTGDVAAKRWKLFDVTTDMIGAKGAFMDFPDLVVGANCLYMTTNVFPQDGVGAAVLRIPFTGIATGNITAKVFLNFEYNSFRVAQNSGSTAYFAAHKDSSTLGVFCWPEADDAPSEKLIGITTWLGENGYKSELPDGRKWLDRVDPRITGAALTDHDAWFAWTVDAGSAGKDHPFIQVARIDATDQTLIENISVFDEQSATAYPALQTNSNGEVGIAYMLGGKTRFPSYMVGFLSEPRKSIEVAVGTRGPLDPDENKGEWGDFLGLRRATPRTNLFAAAGFTMDGTGNGMNRDVTPRFAIFGRQSEVGIGISPASPDHTEPAAVAPSPEAPRPPSGPIPPAAPPPAPAPLAAGSVFTDVSSLPVVNAATAAKVLKAAMDAGGAALQADEKGLQFVNPELATKPGTERWSIKTGQDSAVARVGDLMVVSGKGIVPVTVEELIRIPRPGDMLPVTGEIRKYETVRATPLEFIVWQVTGSIIFLKLEADGDYHMVLQGASGSTMVAEVPTPTSPFLGSCPWTANIKDVRAAVDQKFKNAVQPHNFTMLDGTLVPKESLSSPPTMSMPALPELMTTPVEGQEAKAPTFKTAIPSTRARVTGVGFFDKVHGQDGVSTFNGIELHPVLKVEFL